MRGSQSAKLRAIVVNIFSWRRSAIRVRSKQKQAPRHPTSLAQLAIVCAIADLPLPAVPDNHKTRGTSSPVLPIHDLISDRMSSRVPRRHRLVVFIPAPDAYSIPPKSRSSAGDHKSSIVREHPESV